MGPPDTGAPVSTELSMAPDREPSYGWADGIKTPFWGVYDRRWMVNNMPFFSVFVLLFLVLSLSLVKSIESGICLECIESLAMLCMSLSISAYRFRSAKLSSSTDL